MRLTPAPKGPAGQASAPDGAVSGPGTPPLANQKVCQGVLHVR